MALLSWESVLPGCILHFGASCCPWNCRVGVHGSTTHEQPRRTISLRHLPIGWATNLNFTGWGEGTGRQASEPSAALGLDLQVTSHYPVPFCGFVLGVKRSILVASPKLRFHCTRGISRIHCFALFCTYVLLPFEDFVVAYGCKYRNAAKKQKEPRPSQKSESVSGFWVAELLV